MNMCVGRLWSGRARIDVSVHLCVAVGQRCGHSAAEPVRTGWLCGLQPDLEPALWPSGWGQAVWLTVRPLWQSEILAG